MSKILSQNDQKLIPDEIDEVKLESEDQEYN